MDYRWVVNDILLGLYVTVLGLVIIVLAVIRHAARLRSASRLDPSVSDAPRGVVDPRRTVAVVLVGGDLARSPRMQYHASSLARCGLFSEVRCVGFDEGNQVSEALRDEQLSSTIRLLLVRPTRIAAFGGTVGWLWRSLIRVFDASIVMLRLLWRATAPCGDAGSSVTTAVMLVQTPPAVPFLALVHLVSLVRSVHDSLLWHAFDQRGTRVSIVIDFHNVGYTLLEIEHRPWWVVAMYKTAETLFGAGNAHFTVSNAMRWALSQQRGWGNIGFRSVVVLHDCAPPFFAPCPTSERRRWLAAVTSSEALTVPDWVPAHRPGDGDLVVVSSTSWTADDDYELVLDALTALLQRLQCLRAPLRIPRVWLLITGKGSKRSEFEAAAARRFRSSSIITITTHYFQSYRSYAKMLAVADVGLCVHRSSSGLDLPMKCVDMFGAGIPVAALAYDALDELVTSENGWTFSNAETLERILHSLVDPLTESDELLRRTRAVLDKRVTWDDEWNAKAFPRLTELIEASQRQN